MDEYLENHLIISLAKADYPLFFRNDIPMMKELEAEGYCKVDEAGKVVYDSWGMGVRIGEDGFFCCFQPLEKKLDRKFAEKWMPERIWEAVTADTLEERVRKWTPPDPDHQGNFEWCARDIKTYGEEYFVFPSGYFGIYERAYGMVGIPTLFESVLLAPKMVAELLEKITRLQDRAGEALREDGASPRRGTWGTTWARRWGRSCRRRCTRSCCSRSTRSCSRSTRTRAGT